MSRRLAGLVALASLLLFAVHAQAQQDLPPPPQVPPTGAPPSAGDAAADAADSGPVPLLKPTIDLKLMAAGEGNAWLGHSEQVVGAPVDGWNEGALELGLDLSKDIGERGGLSGRVTGLLTWTRGGVDAGGSNIDDLTPTKVVLDDAWLGWRSHESPEGSFFEVKAGRIEYKLGSGFLFWDGGYEGGDRGAFWINPHDAWELGAAARVKRGRVALRGSYLQPDDQTTTRILSLDAEVGLGDAGGFGTSYHHFLESDALETLGLPGRDGLDVFSLRAELRPFAAARGLGLSGELAFERNADQRHAVAGFVEGGYRFEKTGWTPRLFYRFSYFGGDDPATEADEAWDPLYFAFNDWAVWYLGEILGEYVATNSNQLTHLAGLELNPAESLRAMLLYYHFQFDERPRILRSRLGQRAVDLGSRAIGDELNLALEWSPTEYLDLTAVAGIFEPGGAIRQLTGGDGNWKHAMAYVRVGF